MSRNHSSHIEQKYLFPAGQREMILDWLAHACLPDPGFDSGVVSTLYYDTPAFSHYQESNNGDFQKCKVRLRWYGALPEDRDSKASCILEIERKQGAACRKRRLPLPLSLGLIGALTIIRFRTPIKEPEEVGFIMLVIASAIVCATFNYLLLAVLLALALFVLLAQRYFPRLFGSKRSDGILLITLNGAVAAATRDRLLGILEARIVEGRLQGISSSEKLTTIHYSFAGLYSSKLPGLEASLKEVAPVQKINIFFNRQGVLL